jgi:hypothetical protein
MKLGTVACTFAALALLAQAHPAPAQQGSETPAITTDVPGRSTRDLATLCDAGLQEPRRTDALAYCNGFIVGVGQFHTSLTATGGVQQPIFCVPEPQPTLSQVAAAFVTWTRGHPQHGSERAVDGLMRFAAEAFPCPTVPATRRR